MATENETEKQVYPRIPTRCWWELRKKAQSAVPSKIDVNYLCTVLNIQEGAAKNLLPHLRRVGLINEENVVQNEFHDWRDDETYASYCSVVLERVYPEALRSAEPPPDPDPERVTGWFSRNNKVGSAAARQMATTYVLLCKQDASQATDAPVRAKTQTTSKTNPRKVTQPKQTKTIANPADEKSDHKKGVRASLAFNVQIHIHPDASPEQIDQIFASIAKHLGPIETE